MTSEKDIASGMPGAGASAMGGGSAFPPAPSAAAAGAEPRKIEDVLASEGFYMGPPAGVSMWPMLRNRHDVMLVVPAEGKLRRYDVALYRRGGKYVTLEYIPCGDVLGVLCGFYRDGRHIDCRTSRGYHAYSKLWVALFPARKVCKGANAAIRRAGKRVLVACGLRDRDAAGKAGRK